jgi:[CysO sulfur-carrier protein]-S-L-cysteine hydrolase
MDVLNEFRLQVPRILLEEMIEQARTELPNECCGALAGIMIGDTGRVIRRYPFVNSAASPVRYSAEGNDLPAAFRDMRESQIELLALYHSHPTSAAIPSKTDLAMNFYGPDVVHLIISLQEREPCVRCWRLTDANFRPADWESPG